MGNFMKGVSDGRLIESEAKILGYSGLNFDHFKIDNIVIDTDGNYIRTIQIGIPPDGEHRPKCVLLHGYGASGAIFFKIMKDLADAGIHLILIDIIGMGSSSRPEFDKEQTAEQADEYFVGFLENWRKAFGDLKDFYLAGHSFGGYVCGNYAIKYPQYIKKLLMLSPVGVCKKPDNYDFSTNKSTFASIVRSAWKNKWSPFGILRNSGSLIGNSLIKKYISRRMKDSLSPEEQQDMLKYMHQIFMREGSTEYAIFICFEIGLWALNPLESETRLGNPDIAIPISFYYGDSDWMDHRGGRRVVDKNIFKYSNEATEDKGMSQVHIINESDHHLYLDNPKELAGLMIADIFQAEEFFSSKHKA